jgi:hypothetical protein
VGILQLSFVTPLGNWKQPLGTFMLLASDGSDFLQWESILLSCTVGLGFS